MANRDMQVAKVHLVDGYITIAILGNMEKTATIRLESNNSKAWAITANPTDSSPAASQCVRVAI